MARTLGVEHDVQLVSGSATSRGLVSGPGPLGGLQRSMRHDAVLPRGRLTIGAAVALGASAQQHEGALISVRL